MKKLMIIFLIFLANFNYEVYAAEKEVEKTTDWQDIDDDDFNLKEGCKSICCSLKNCLKCCFKLLVISYRIKKIEQIPDKEGQDLEMLKLLQDLEKDR